MTDHQPARPVPIDEARAREVLEQARCEAKDFQWSARISTQTAIRAMLALATEAAQPADGAGVPADAAREYFERGFLASYAWHVTKREGETLSDAALDHAWDNREEGGPLPTLTATPNAPPSTAGEVERLARVLCAAETGGPIGYFPDGSPMRTGGVWEEYAEYQHEEWRRVARAVLAALASPSPVASGAGGESVHHRQARELMTPQSGSVAAKPGGQSYGAATPPAPSDDLRAALEDLTRPLAGIENRTPEEVRDILFDRIRRKFAALSGERKA